MMTDRELMQQALSALVTAELDGNCEYGVTDSLRARLAQPEPAECDGGQCGIGGYCKDCPKTNPEKKWVGLTDAERELAAWSSSDFLKMAESIEAKLREKNG